MRFIYWLIAILAAFAAGWMIGQWQADKMFKEIQDDLEFLRVEFERLRAQIGRVR